MIVENIVERVSVGAGALSRPHQTHGAALARQEGPWRLILPEDRLATKTRLYESKIKRASSITDLVNNRQFAWPGQSARRSGAWRWSQARGHGAKSCAARR